MLLRPETYFLSTLRAKIYKTEYQAFPSSSINFILVGYFITCSSRFRPRITTYQKVIKIFRPSTKSNDTSAFISVTYHLIFHLTHAVSQIAPCRF